MSLFTKLLDGMGQSFFFILKALLDTWMICESFSRFDVKVPQSHNNPHLIRSGGGVPDPQSMNSVLILSVAELCEPIEARCLSHDLQGLNITGAVLSQSEGIYPKIIAMCPIHYTHKILRSWKISCTHIT